MISVVRDRYTEIPFMDDSVQKSFCGERLPAKRDPDFACTNNLHVNVPEYGTTIEYTRTLM